MEAFDWEDLTLAKIIPSKDMPGAGLTHCFTFLPSLLWKP